MSLFPLRSIPTDTLARELAAKANVSQSEARAFLWTNLSNGGATIRGDEDRGTFTAIEAYRFLSFVRQGGRFQPGSEPEGNRYRRFQQLAAPTAELFHQQFFDGVRLSESNAKALGLLKPFPITKLHSVHDGDTWKADMRLPGTKDVIKRSMRFAAYDTPEVGGPKLDSQLEKLMMEFTQSTGGAIRGKLERESYRRALELSLKYQGDLAGLLWKDMTSWIEQKRGGLEMAASYTHGGDSGAACGMYDMVGHYGRWIGIPQVTRAELLSQYMRERLPEMMATEGEALYARYQQDIRTDSRLPQLLSQLARRGTKGKYAAQLVDPSLWTRPSEAYHPQRVMERAQSWNRLTRSSSSDPERQGYQRDLAALTIHLGLAYHYVKYRSQRSPFYEYVEAEAKQKQHGLWANPLFRHMEWTNDPGQCTPSVG